VLQKDDEMLSERLHLLADTLKEMGYGHGYAGKTESTSKGV
jgi:hypothetical protein